MIIEDQPSGARPVILPIMIYTTAKKIKMMPASPEYKQIFTGRFENEKMASKASAINLVNVIFASPWLRWGREYST